LGSLHQTCFRRPARRLAQELVANAIERHDVFRLGRPGFDLLPELCDVIVNRSRKEVSGDSSDVVEQLFARHDMAAPLDQVLENLELARRQRQRLAVKKVNG